MCVLLLHWAEINHHSEFCIPIGEYAFDACCRLENVTAPQRLKRSTNAFPKNAVIHGYETTSSISFASLFVMRVNCLLFFAVWSCDYVLPELLEFVDQRLSQLPAVQKELSIQCDCMGDQIMANRTIKQPLEVYNQAGTSSG